MKIKLDENLPLRLATLLKGLARGIVRDAATPGGG